jgi:MFS family permease
LASRRLCDNNQTIVTMTTETITSRSQESQFVKTKPISAACNGSGRAADALSMVDSDQLESSLERLERTGPEMGAKKPKRQGDHLKWWRRTRIHVALLGLAIGVVNCYAQATFCIAIVEMVLPADYEPTTAKHDDSTAASLMGPPKQDNVAVLAEDLSCPIEFKYRNYYDDWRFYVEPKNNYSHLESGGNSTSTGGGGGGPKIIEPNQSGQKIDVSNRFAWDATQQGMLLGAFAIGTAPLQIVGGRLAEIYGSKWVLLMGCVGTGLTNLAIPHLAHFSFFLLLANRILMGVSQAGMEPGLMCLLADWLTPREASFFISMLMVSMCLGFFFGSLCSSFILALGYGWPLTYYICGALNLLVALVWHVYADSWPRASKYISSDELHYIMSRQRKAAAATAAAASQVSSTPTTGNSGRLGAAKSPSSFEQIGEFATTTMSSDISKQESRSMPTSNELCLDHEPAANHQTGNELRLAVPEEPTRTPWLNILSSRPVWAFIICKISIRWCADVISNELPTYLANVLHLSIKINGLLNSVSTALFAISSFLTGCLATSQLFAKSNSSQHSMTSSQQNRNKTIQRKVFQSAASFGTAICLIFMTRYDCDIFISMSCLLLLSCFIVMGTGGELQIAYDMTSRYPGTLHGMACTLSVSGWLAPPLYGLILGDQASSRARWSIVWYSTAAINLLGGLIFVLFADASPIDFDRPRKAQQRQAPKRPELAQPNDGCYLNGALSSSSCESSPKSNHQANIKNTSSGGNSSSNNNRGKLHPLDACVRFDCDELIKCRQPESCLIQTKASSYWLDSPLRLEAIDLMIYPYKEPDNTSCLPEASGADDAASVGWRLANVMRRLPPRRFGLAKVATTIKSNSSSNNNNNWPLNSGPISGPRANEPNKQPIETINRSSGSHDSGVRFGSQREGGRMVGPNESCHSENCPSAAAHQDGVHRQTAAAAAVTADGLVELIGNAATTTTAAGLAPYCGAITEGRRPSCGRQPSPAVTKSSPLLATEAARQKTITHL